MARVIVYKSKSKNEICIVNEMSNNGVKVREILDELKLREVVVFLNNERTTDLEYVLKKEDLLFIFLRKNN